MSRWITSLSAHLRVPHSDDPTAPDPTGDRGPLLPGGPDPSGLEQGASVGVFGHVEKLKLSPLEERHGEETKQKSGKATFCGFVWKQIYE